MLPCRRPVKHYLGRLTEHLGASEVQTIMSLQGGSSASLIRQSMTAYKQVNPLIALTKLDECETTPAEFSALAEQEASIALLSGTRSVVGALAFASGNNQPISNREFHLLCV